MNYKRIGGLVALVAGIALIVYSVRTMHSIAQAKQEVQAMSKEMSNNMVGKKVSGSMMSSASQYDTEIMISLFAGIGLAVIGGALAIFCKTKKK